MHSGTKWGMAGGRVGGIIEQNLINKAKVFVNETIKKPIARCIRSREKENNWIIKHAIVNGL